MTTFFSDIPQPSSLFFHSFPSRVPRSYLHNAFVQAAADEVAETENHHITGLWTISQHM